MAICGGRLAVALMNKPEVDKIAAALSEARNALSWAEACIGEVRAALEPATDGEIEAELTRLVRAWPQDKRGDLAGYGAELAIFVLEARPSRRALEQACRGLKLGRVHLPSIAEVMTALDAAEGTLSSAAQQLDALPGRIARAEALLDHARPTRATADKAA
ncbi:MAG: hypothetical protein ACRYGP_13785 [Janthinobacterium lividum]